MRKCLISIVFSLLLVCTACGNRASTVEVASSREGLRMTVAGMPDKEHLTLNIENDIPDAEILIEGDMDYQVEVFKNGMWCTVPLKKNLLNSGITSNLDANECASGQSLTQNVWVGYRYRTLSAGHYRILKNIQINCNGNTDRIVYAAEFDVS